VLLGALTCCAFGKNAADVPLGLSIATACRFCCCIVFRLDRKNNQIAATSTSATAMEVGNIILRRFEEDADLRDGDTELLVEGTTEDADRVA